MPETAFFLGRGWLCLSVEESISMVEYEPALGFCEVLSNMMINLLSAFYLPLPFGGDGEGDDV
jgi:hypothetical protein